MHYKQNKLGRQVFFHYKDVNLENKGNFVQLRVSGHKQKPHLRNYQKYVRDWFRSKKLTINGIILETGNSRTHRRKGLRSLIKQALQWQEKHKREALIWTTHRNRTIRGEDYDGTAVSDSITNKQSNDLLEFTRGLKIVTIKHPETSFKECRVFEMSLQKSRSCKEIKNKSLSRAIRLHMNGISNREIGRRIGVSDMTIGRWLKEYVEMSSDWLTTRKVT